MVKIIILVATLGLLASQTNAGILTNHLFGQQAAVAQESAASQQVAASQSQQSQTGSRDKIGTGISFGNPLLGGFSFNTGIEKDRYQSNSQQSNFNAASSQVNKVNSGISSFGQLAQGFL